MKITNCKTQNHPLLFQGLQENLAMGKEVTREFRKEFGRLHSSSWVDTLLSRRGGFWNAPYKMIELRDKYTLQAQLLRGDKNAFYKEKFNSYEDFIEQLKLRMKKYKSGNCVEQAYIISDMLEKMKIKSKQLILNLYLKDSDDEIPKGIRHVVNIANHAEPFKVSKPNQWGEDAVIIDTWGISNGTIKAKDAPAYYRDLFQKSADRYKFVPELSTCKLVNNELVIKRGNNLVKL